MHDAHSCSTLVSPDSAGVSQVASCGFYLAIRPGGFALYMSASQEHMRRMRACVYSAVVSSGASEQVAEAARLVASELVGNAVRLCGPWAPVVVQVISTSEQARVQVHDPDSSARPRRNTDPPDNGCLESGRGLWILDSLAPGWTVENTAIGKQVTATLPCREFVAV